MSFGPRARQSAKMPVARRPAALAAMLAMLAAIIGPAAAQHPEIAQRRALERKIFSNAEIIGGFFRVMLGAEFHVGGGVDRVRKFQGPIRVYIDSRASPDRSEQITAVIADIRARIRDIDLATSSRRSDANILVSVVHERDLSRTIRSLYGLDRANHIQRSLEPQCLSGFRKDESYRLLDSDVILVADAGDFIFYDCLYEELLQALGPMNDDATLQWSMFNDNNQMGFFDVFDQYILNILYDPRIKPGMTRNEVEAVLPNILPSVRAWIAKVNKLAQ